MLLVITVALTIASIINSTRNEVFREASSGHNINAHLLALNITTTIELLLQMLPASGLAYALRNSLTPFYVFYLNFALLAWVSAGWASILYPTFPATIVLFAVTSLSSLLLSGTVPPFEYEQVYATIGSQLLTGFLSPTRFFLKSLSVSEFKW